MFYAPLSNPNLHRTLRPIYAQHQATPYGGFLDPNWQRTFDILPGTVMARLENEVFTPFTPTLAASGAVPFGLSALFVAPSLGVDEVTATGTNLFTVWTGNNQAVFEILAPAFDSTASWTTPNNGSITLLTANANGLLTPTGANNSNSIAELVSVETTSKILIRLNNLNPAAAWTG